MSLFGGSARQAPYEIDISRTTSLQSSPQSSPSAIEFTNSDGTQFIQEIEEPLKVDSDDDYGPSSDVQDGEYESELSTRPNRFNGPPQTWRSYTESDRRIVASLDQIDDSDFAVHLAYIHGLKRCFLRPANELTELKNWQSRHLWLLPEQELSFMNLVSGIEGEKVYSLKKVLAGIQAPHRPQYQRLNWIDGELNQWMVGLADATHAGAELRQELLAMFLRLAKDQWMARPGDDRTVVSRQKRPQSNRFNPQAASGKEKANNADIDLDLLSNNNDDRQDRTARKRRGRQPKVAKPTRADIMADDTKAEALLLPVINSVLSQLDNLAMAVRRTSQNHVEVSTKKRLRSRLGPKAKSKTAGSRKASNQSEPRVTSTSQKSSKRGEAQRFRPRDSENHHSTTDSPAQSAVDTKDRKRRRIESKTRGSPLDWSEVLGLAAVTGWDQGAVARAAQRCATLFGESMSFLPCDENAALDPLPEPVRYTPSIIPAPDVVPFVKSPELKRPYFQPSTTRCPHTECKNHEKEFSLPKNVVQHVISIHGYDPRTNDSDNEERKFGGVHVDGFLQPIAAKYGWLGPGREKASMPSRKKSKKLMFRNVEDSESLESQ